MSIGDRPTADVILILLTIMICSAILLTGGGIFIIALVNPEYPLATAFASLGQVLVLLIGAIIGYLAGRGRSAQSKETT